MVDGNFSNCVFSSSPIIKTISPTILADDFPGNTSTSVNYSPYLLPVNESSNSSNLSTDTLANCSLFNVTAEPTLGGSSPFPGKIVVIPLYTLIFFLSIIGNSLVIFTLAWNRRMRTVTNVFLLNLAISDLLLGVFCMPVTLVGQILRRFVFGHLMCKIIPYFQAVSVSVGVWTLVAISLERYFAICRPLQSRKWQTRSHAYKMILAVWIFTLSWNIPITFVSEMQPIHNTGRYKCREIWPNTGSEKTFNLFLDFLLLVCPLCIMAMAYSLIISKLWKGLKNEIHQSRSFHQQQGQHCSVPRDISMELSNHSHHSKCKISGNNGGGGTTTATTTGASVRLSSSRDGMSNEIVTLRGGKGVVVRWKRKDAVEVADCSNSLKSQSTGACESLPAQSSHSTSHPCSAHCPNHAPVSTRGCTNYRHHHTTRPFTHHLSAATAAGRQQSTNKHTGGPTYNNSSSHNHKESNKGPKFSRAIRSTYTGKSIESKKKVIRMLFVLVAEFFVCWTPLYVMNTWYLFDREAVYNTMGPLGVTLVQLLAYVSSCCNPITYCFMNRKFRQAFLKVFQCGILRVTTAKSGPPSIVRSSDLSANDSLILGVQASKSEVLALEFEHRV